MPRGELIVLSCESDPNSRPVAAAGQPAVNLSQDFSGLWLHFSAGTAGLCAVLSPDS